MLRVVNVEVKFHEVILVLRGVSLELPQGAIVCVLGANGAGKTTLLKAISGLLRFEVGRVTDGFIELEGRRIERASPDEIARCGILQVMEGRRVLEHLTIEENLLVGALARPNGRAVKQELEKVYHYFPRLIELRDKTAGYLSGGEQQMAVIGRALMGRPSVMLLDEPSLGLSPVLVRDIFDILKRINVEERVSMLIVEQNARRALEIAHHGYVLENGRVVLDGSAEKLTENADIKEFYLGLSELGNRKSYRDVKHYKRRKRWL